MINFPDSFKDKNILVVGAAGFIPSTLAEFYLQKGATVIGIDNFITGSQRNIDILNSYDNFNFFEFDICDGIPQISERIDYIFSMASPASPIDFKIIPMEIMKTNSFGTLNILELAKEKSARFLLASTSEIYGDPLVHPQTEDYHGNVNTLGPRACYDESKRFGETLTMTYNRLYKLETRIVRIFNTYGPRMRPNDGRVIVNFVNQALKGEDLTVYGEGMQTRSFCYVDDLVNAIHNVMFSSDHMPFNCGNPDEYTIKRAAEIIIKTLKSSSKISYINDSDILIDDPLQRRPNMKKLYDASSYKPKVSFEEGLEKTAHYFKQLL